MIYEVTEDTFSTEVLSSEVPVLVDFYGPTCVPCRMIEPHLKSISEKPEVLKVTKVDATKAKGLLETYKVRAVPTLLVFKGGKEVSRSVGGLTKNELEFFVEESLGDKDDH